MQTLIMAALIAASAPSGPLYLDCVVHQTSRDLLINLRLDEAQQRATITNPASQHVAARPAAFTASEVRIPDDFQTWVVDRSSLRLRQLVDLGGIQSEAGGECKIAAPSASRKF